MYNENAQMYQALRSGYSQKKQQFYSKTIEICIVNLLVRLKMLLHLFFAINQILAPRKSTFIRSFSRTIFSIRYFVNNLVKQKMRVIYLFILSSSLVLSNTQYSMQNVRNKRNEDYFVRREASAIISYQVHIIMNIMIHALSNTRTPA